ncbi:O-antigen ligase family protein [Microbacterium sp. 16-032]|uniref:O-antigen ligase family protein n=1 Tax=Microbacterium sp. 16-032 TaxID=3239808 RepID=UPI0034E1A348
MTNDSHGQRALGIALTIAITALTLWPSSATAQLPVGSFYPIFVALLALLTGLGVAGKRLKRPPFVWPLVAFYVIVTISSLVFTEANPFSLLIGAVAIPAYWAAYSAGDREKRRVVQAVIALAVVETALAFGEVLLRTGVLLGTPFRLSPENPFFEGAPRAQGTLAHPLALSFVLLVALGFVCARRSHAAMRMILVAVFVVGVLLTGSASAAVIAALIVIYWFLNRATPVGVTFAILSAMAAVVLVAASGFVATVFEQEFDQRNAGHRLNSIAAIPSLAFGRDAPQALIGSGYDVRNLYTSGYFVNDGFFTIDNQYVSFLAQGGLIGLVLAVTVLVGLTVRSSRRYLPGWIGLLGMGMSFDFMSWYALATLTLVYAAIAARPQVTRETSPPQPSLSRPNRRGTVSPMRLSERSTSR